MSRASHLVAKNILVSGFGQILVTGLTLLTTIMTARYLGVAGFGRFSFLFGIAIVVWFIGEAGLMGILVRELSQKLESLEEFHDTLATFRGLISCISFAIIILSLSFSILVFQDLELRLTVVLLSLAIAAMLQALALASVIRAYEEMEYQVIGLIIQNVCLVIGMFLVTYLDAGFVAVFLAYTCSYLVLWLYLWVLVKLRFGLLRAALNIAKWKYFLKESFPLGVGQIMRRTANYMDIFILKFTGGLTDIGLFSAAYRFILALSGTAITITLPFLPAFAKLGSDPDFQMHLLLEKGLLFLIILAIPLTIIFFIYGSLIMSLCFGIKFMQAGPSMRLLSFTLLFIFPSALLLQLFTALGKQKFWTICAGLSLILRTLLDLILTPKWGFMGAAWAALGAEICLFVASWYLLRTLSFRIPLGRILARLLPVGLIIGVILSRFPGETLAEICIHATGALLLYVISLWVLRVFSMKELLSLIRTPKPVGVDR